jgi:hypothetical protein
MNVFFLFHFMTYCQKFLCHVQLFKKVCIMEIKLETPVFIHSLSSANTGTLEVSVNLQAYKVAPCRQEA